MQEATVVRREPPAPRLQAGEQGAERSHELQDEPGVPEVAMNQSQTHTLEVPGATLQYEVGGAGPVLLLIPGGPADAGAFAPIRGELSDRYTVVTYDPRGLSRSPFDGEPQDTSVGTFADDARRLIEAGGNWPGFLFPQRG